MSRVCDVTGKRTRVGNKKTTRGLAKHKGGVGTKITGKVKRRFKVNLQNKKIWVPELNQWVKVRVCARALRTMAKKGSYRTLVEAGVIKPIRHTPKRTSA